MKRGAAESDRPAPIRSDMESRVRRSPAEVDPERALVDLALALALGVPPVEQCRMTLDALSALFPDHAIGICFVRADGEPPWIDCRVPSGAVSPERDPTRLFPEYADECILPLEGNHGSTVHLGRARGPIARDAIERVAVGRATTLLGRTLAQALRAEAARPAAAELGELRTQLVQAEKLATLGQIVAGVVHELANPLTSIVACTEYLLRKSDGQAAPEDREQLKRIGVSADRILKFSRDLVAYARPAQERPEPLALHEVIGQAEEFSRHELDRRGVSFLADFSSGAPPVLGQTGPLTQVFVNLFTNAAHAMSDRGGMLVVRTRAAPAEQCVYVEVTDTGIGIPRQDLDRIFEPFFTTKEKGHGTGLGLAIVRDIVSAHRGTVSVASTPGEGTTFTLRLPTFDAVPASRRGST
jgi:two-component system NtrC family sensor kinase